MKITDKMRLDWLSSQHIKGFVLYGGYELHVVEGGRQFIAGSLRQAIDSAIHQSKKAPRAS